MIQLTEKEKEARRRVCLAVDVASANDAYVLMSTLGQYVGMAKIGKQLHTAAGMEGEILGHLLLVELFVQGHDMVDYAPVNFIDRYDAVKP